MVNQFVRISKEMEEKTLGVADKIKSIFQKKGFSFY